MTDKELLAFAKKAKRVLDAAWNKHDNPFGIAHNDAADLDSELDQLIDKLSRVNGGFHA